MSYDFRIMKLFLGMILMALPVAAQSVNSHHFKFSDTLETVGMEDALGPQSQLIQSQNPFLFRASLDYAHDSLSATNLTNNPLSIVDHMYSLTLGGSAIVHPRILVGITGSMHWVQLSNAYVSGQFNERAWKLGDVNAHVKFRLTGDHSRINIAVSPFLNVPTGSSQYLVSDDSFRFGGRIISDTTIQRWKFYFHTGMSYASDAQFLGLDERKFLDIAAGTFYTINSKFGVNAEWLQSISVWELENGQNPTQVNLGIRYDAGSTKVFIGGGVQGFDFSDSNRPYMFYAGIKQPFGAKRQPLVPTNVPTPVEEIDSEMVQVTKSISEMVVHFDNNSAQVKSEYVETLNQAAQWMKQFAGKIQYLVVHGHSDPRGDEGYNKRLSERRAKSVKNYLIEQGVDEYAILLDGYGETALKTTDAKDYHNNRRVEFQVIKK